MRKLTNEDLKQRVSIKEVNDFCSSNGLRIKSKKFDTTTKPMGSGGVGQIKHMKRSNTLRVQLSYGTGKYNYAKVAIFELT